MEQESSYSRFMNFVKNFWGGCSAVNSISHGIDTSTPKEKIQEYEPMQIEFQNKEDDDDSSSV